VKLLTPELFELAGKMIENQITPEILKLLPFELTGLRQCDNRCYLMESSQRKFFFWIHQGREASLASRSQLLSICQQMGVLGFLYPIALAAGNTYERFNERFWFYITDWKKFAKISYGNFNHLQSVVGIMAGFRKVLTQNGPAIYLPEYGVNHGLIERATQILENLRQFSMLARYRLRPTKYDKLFLDYYPKLIEQIKRALVLFEKAGYGKLRAGLTTQALIIANFSRSNLWVAENQAYCLKLKNCRRELSIIDLAALIEKSGRSNKWTPLWFARMIAEYRKYFEITPAEMLILKIYISIPWSICRLSSRYYFNGAEWGTAKFVDKLEKLLITEPNRRRLIEELLSI